jgi:hypothetical protein
MFAALDCLLARIRLARWTLLSMGYSWGTEGFLTVFGCFRALSPQCDNLQSVDPVPDPYFGRYGIVAAAGAFGLVRLIVLSPDERLSARPRPGSNCGGASPPWRRNFIRKIAGKSTITFRIQFSGMTPARLTRTGRTTNSLGRSRRHRRSRRKAR